MPIPKVNCPACNGTGWLGYTREIGGKRYPWSGACRCSAGNWLTEPREPTESIPRPILICYAPMDVYEKARRRGLEYAQMRQEREKEQAA